jgi:hypothetical protein
VKPEPVQVDNAAWLVLIPIIVVGWAAWRAKP